MNLVKEKKKKYLQEICNKYGDFKVCSVFKDSDGNLNWFKHHSVLDLWGSDYGLYLLQKVNNRTSLEGEIIIDLDGEITGKEVDYKCDILSNMGLDYDCFFSGSKGYHIHILFKNIYSNKLDKKEREFLRYLFLKKINKADLMKKSESSMIALEFNPHYKTGVVKTWLRGTGWLLKFLNC